MNEDIMKVCERNQSDLRRVLPPYEKRGILNSELLLACSIMDIYDPEIILESGVARGHSTEVFARFFPEKKIIAFEKADDEDAKYGKDRVSRYGNVNYQYGDVFSLVPKFTKQRFVAVIDGPKGLDAIKLARLFYKNDRCLAIMIHDFHSNAEERADLERAFPNVFYSDDPEFVERFRYLDHDCWEKMNKKKFAPYLRHGRPMKSYGSTLAVII